MSAVTKEEAGIVHQSRWGYHPCSYETFAKLKRLKKAYWQRIRDSAAWERWARKEPQNRVIRKRIRNEAGQVIGYEAPVPRPEPTVGPYVSPKVLQDFDRARMPATSPEGVARMSLSQANIDKLIEAVAGFYGK